MHLRSHLLMFDFFVFGFGKLTVKSDSSHHRHSKAGLSLLYELGDAVGWCYWQGNRLAIHRSLVQVLAGSHCIVTFAKLPVCAFVTKQSNLVPAKGGDLFG